MSIKLKIEGLSEILLQIEKANKSADAAAERCIREAAEIMEDKLKEEMVASDNQGVLGATGGLFFLAQQMPPYRVEKDFGKVSAHVGYHKGDYDPKNISDGYKVIFVNYGTPRRPDKQGQIKGRGFIARAKRKAAPLIKAKEEKTLKEILENVK